MYKRKTFDVVILTDGFTKGKVRLTERDYVFSYEDAAEYARACLIPSHGWSTIYVNGGWVWNGKFNKSYSTRIKNKRIDKIRKGDIIQI